VISQTVQTIDKQTHPQTVATENILPRYVIAVQVVNAN